MLKHQSLAAGLLCALMATTLSAPMLSVQAADVTGKVVAVYHEPVLVNTRWMDKVSVTLDNCATPGQFATFSYTPGTVSEDNALDFLFRDLANAARTTVTKNQYMTIVGGHATLSVNDQKTIQKTTFWGHNWECGRNVSAGGGAPYGSSNASPAPQTQQQPAPQGGAKPKIGVPSLGRFGF